MKRRPNPLHTGARKCNFSFHYIKKSTIYSGVSLRRRWWNVLTVQGSTRSSDGCTDVYQQRARADLRWAVRAPRRIKERLLTWLMTVLLLLLSVMSFAWISHRWLIVHPLRVRLVHNMFGLLKPGIVLYTASKISRLKYRIYRNRDVQYFNDRMYCYNP